MKVLEIKGETERKVELCRDPQRSVLSASFSLLLAVAVVSHFHLPFCFALSAPFALWLCLTSLLVLQLFTEGQALEQLFGCVNRGPPSTAALRYAEQCVPISQGLSTLPAHSPAKWDASMEFSQTDFVYFLQPWVVFWWCGHILSL